MITIKQEKRLWELEEKASTGEITEAENEELQKLLDIIYNK